MRIGVNCFTLQEHIGGLRQYFHRLFRELLANDHENSYVFFHAGHNLKEMELLGNERWKDGALLLKDQGEILLHLDKIDVYFCPFNGLFPRPMPVPSVVKIADIQETYYPQFFSEAELQWREDNYAPSTRTADIVITVSEFSKETIALHHQIAKDKIRVAYHTAEEFISLPGEAQESIALDLPERFIFYPANRWLHKNHDNLLQALVVLKNRYALTIDCVLTGHDYATGGYPLREKINEYGLAGQIKILGYVSEDEVKYIYQKAEMLCFPSLFEGFGMPLVEAMASGCPVVCSNVASIPEVAGEAALLFDPDEPEDIAAKIAILWNNAEERSKLVALGRKRALYFSTKKMADVHLEAFKAAATSFKGSRDLYFHYVFEPLYKFLREQPVALRECEAERSVLHNRVEAMQASLSWRITAPLRKVLDLFRRL